MRTVEYPTLVQRITRRRPPQPKEVKSERRGIVVKTEEEREVIAAFVLAGRELTNAELAEFMRVSPGEASKRVAALGNKLTTWRVGREVWIRPASWFILIGA